MCSWRARVESWRGRTVVFGLAADCVGEGGDEARRRAPRGAREARASLGGREHCSSRTSRAPVPPARACGRGERVELIGVGGVAERKLLRRATHARAALRGTAFPSSPPFRAELSACAASVRPSVKGADGRRRVAKEARAREARGRIHPLGPRKGVRAAPPFRPRNRVRASGRDGARCWALPSFFAGTDSIGRRARARARRGARHVAGVTPEFPPRATPSPFSLGVAAARPHGNAECLEQPLRCACARTRPLWQGRASELCPRGVCAPVARGTRAR